MKKVLLLIITSVAYVLQSHAQVFWLENWTSCTCDSLCKSYTGPNGPWAITNVGYNGSAANAWYFSYKEQGLGRGACGSGAGTRASAHVGNVSTSPQASILCPYGDCGALNDDAPSSTYTNIRLESPVINCTGKSNITLSFNYIMKGDTLHDYATIWYFNGSVWTKLNKPAQTPPICPGFPISPGLWTYDTIPLPSSANNNPNVKIGFLWFNDTTAVADNNLDYPSFAVDSIALSSAVPLGANNINTANGNLTLYPNPNDGRFTIQIPLIIDRDPYLFEIYNVIGDMLAKVQVKSGLNSVNFSYFSSGLYLYRVIDQNGNLLGRGKVEIANDR